MGKRVTSTFSKFRAFIRVLVHVRGVDMGGGGGVEKKTRGGVQVSTQNDLKEYQSLEYASTQESRKEGG